MHTSRRAILLAAPLCLSPILARAQPADTKPARMQVALSAWLDRRAGPEHVTGVSAYVSFGAARPPIQAAAGRTGTAPGAPPVTPATLFQMGSTSKSFAAAILLQLEAQGRLSLNDGLGKYLPQYSAWKSVTLRRLLNMTSGIPNYSETEAISRIWTTQPMRSLTPAQLVAMVYTANAVPPAQPGYAYSNTNYILAAMVAEAVTHRPYRDLVQQMVIRPQSLHDTFYEPGAYPPAVLARLSHGYFANPACADFQPNCTRSWNLPLVGKDTSRMSTSWAQAAGGALATAGNVDLWMRAVFTGKVVPASQQAEWTALVSTKTGRAITEVTTDDPQGFALGIARGILGPLGPHWFYQGETLGFRTLYVWFPENDLMITVQTNSQPSEAENKLNELVTALHGIATSP